MKKIIEKIKGFAKWVASDGLLHALVCYAIVLAVFPVFDKPVEGIAAALLLAVVASMGKEVYDLAKGCELKHVWHDLICDAIGIGCAMVTVLIWWLCNL